MIAFYTRGSHTNNKEIFRNPPMAWEINRERSLKMQPAFSKTHSINLLVSCPDTVDLQKRPPPWLNGRGECPFRVEGIIREADVLGPLVANFQRDGKVF